MGIQVLGYGRVSTIDQEISPEVQERQCRQWYQSQCDRGEWKDGSSFVGMVVDKAISGKTELFKRPQGQRILMTLSRGDVLVVSKLSRAFRSVQDMLASVEAFSQIGIRLVLLDMAVDTSTPTGKLMLTVLAAIAEFERELIAERTRDAMRFRISEGQWMGIAPVGWILKTKAMTGTRDNELIPDWEIRDFGKLAASRFAEGASAESISIEINRIVNNHEKHRPPNMRRKPYCDNMMFVWAAYHICDWPPFSKKRMKEEFGKLVFTADWIRQNYDAALEPLGAT